MFRSLAKLQPTTCRVGFGVRINKKMFATVRNVEACGSSFEEIIASRNSCKKYRNERVSDDVLSKILSETIVRSSFY